MSTEKATFGAGCFWGVETAFREIEGVSDVAVGYEGGQLENPTYRDVCSGRTNHAEVVEIDFDPAQVSFEQLARFFFELHDPTQVNRQGPDTGTQYRSAIFFHSPEQQATAERIKSELDASGAFRKPIATEVAPAQTFYRAEEYHQQYLVKTGRASCHAPRPLVAR